MQTENDYSTIQATPPAGTPLHTGQLVPVVPEEEDEESPEAILLRAVTEIPTQPLGAPSKTPHQRAAERRVLLLILLCVLAFVGGALFGALTYPTVTVEVVARTTHAATTAQLSLATRTLAPVTVSGTASALTTGHGHQDATRASGTVTVYNGLFTPQTLAAGTVFTGQDGTTVALAQSVTVPTAVPPQEGEATVTASALVPGTSGNIAADDLDVTIANGVLVKNLAAFSGGRNARDYPAVALHDLERLSASLHQQLLEAIPQAFRLHAGEAVSPTACRFQQSATHQAAAEAQHVTMHAAETCRGLAYDRQALQQQATVALFRQTRPGPSFQLAGAALVTIDRLSPFTVSVRGLWRSSLSSDEEQRLAQHIAGDSPQQARTYLLHTGLIVRASVSGPLPKDPAHIHFVELVEG